MKVHKKKSAAGPRKKPAAKASARSTNGMSSPYGFRQIENEWLQKHPEKLRACAGEYVMVEGEEIVAHSKEPADLARVARQRGIKIPYIFFVEPPLPPNTFRIGWI
ncbi:MAG TPA: DUF5678 domain-containing protein [Candidatus Binataceae bacterium]|nr:DUF5678 domain-containing protein [Candidatus Binataceae bacterium]